MTTLRLLIGVLGLLVSVAQADVVIYKGTLRLKTDIDGGIGAKGPFGMYLLVDFDARQVVDIATFTLNGKKKFQLENPTDLRIVTAEIKGGKTVTILANGTVNTIDSESFNYFLFFVRGVNSTFTIQQTPTRVQVNRPRVISGSVITVGAQNGDGHFGDLSLNLSFQSNATVKANNAGKTLEQVRDDIIAELQAKGFSSVN